jgi:phosphoserine phosphatase RsbU/P
MQADSLSFVFAIAVLTVAAAVGLVLLRRRQSKNAVVSRLGELSSLAEMGRAISSAELDLARLADLIYREAGQIVDTSYFQLGLFEDDRYRLLIWIVDGQPKEPARFRLLPGDLGIVGWLRETRQSLLVRDFERDRDLPARPRYVAADPPRSAVFVPLLVGETALGTIAIQSRRPNAFSEQDVRLLSIVANHAAAALQNARLFEQTRRRATQLELLASVSQRINVLQPLPSLYRQVLDLVADKYSEFCVSYYEAAADGLHLRATTVPTSAIGAAAHPRAPREFLRFGESAVGQAAEQRREVVITDLPALPGDLSAGEHVGAAQSELAVPVQIDDQVMGVLSVQSRAGSILDDSTRLVFGSLAAQMAMAILQARLFAAEQRRAEHLEALAQASRTAASTLDLDDLLDEVLDVVDEHFGYKTVRIFLLYEDQLVFHAGAGGGSVGQAIEGLAYDLNGPGLIALVGRTQQPIVVEDVTAHPDYMVGPGLGSTRAEMAAPMSVGQRLVGVFDVQSDQLAAFSEEDARTLQTLADTLAVAVRNVRLFEYERRRRRLAEIMREVSVALTSTLHLDNVLDLILDGLALVVSYDAASILLANDAGELILRASRGAPGAEEAIGLPLAVRMFGREEPVPSVVPFGEVDEENEYHDLVGLPEPHACLGATLAPGGEHLGYLVVDRAGSTRFPGREVELVVTFASQAAVAIENARLYTAQREQAWISTALLQVAEATAVTTELDDVLATVARLTPMLVGVDRCAIILATDGGWRLAAYAGQGENLSPDKLPAAEPVPVHEWERFQEMLATREATVMEPDDTMPGALRESFVGVVILLPLMAKGEVEGAMIVGQAPGETPFTAHRISLMTGIANQTALAIESAMLSAAQQEEAWVSTALLQVAESVAGQPLETALETVSRLTPMLVGIEKLAIYQWDDASRGFLLREVSGLERPAATALGELAVTPAQLGLASDDPVFNSDVPWQLPVPPSLAELFGCDRVCVWPLRPREAVLGALVVDAVPMLERRLAIMNGIAHQLAMAMENARLMRDVAEQERLERELEVGRDIQATFLPQRFPRPPGWDLSVLWRAARQVGGDFYDFIELRPGPDGERWGVVIADVADKGVPAALFMALSRTLLRTVAISRVSPADTLKRVNQLILSDARSDQFVTIFYGVWEPVTGRLRYAVGGHNPPVWVARDGFVRTLPGRGIALGVLDDVEYAEQEVQLQPGDTLLLYTDGLTDAVNVHDEEFSLVRVFDLLRAAHARPAQLLLQALVAEVEAHVNGREAFDDMTIVVLRRTDQA